MVRQIAHPPRTPAQRATYKAMMALLDQVESTRTRQRVLGLIGDYVQLCARRARDILEARLRDPTTSQEERGDIARILATHPAPWRADND